LRVVSKTADIQPPVLAGRERRGIIHPVKRSIEIILTLVIPTLVVSCESTNSRRAGGGAFDGTPMGETLDGNAIVPDQEDLAKRSFEAWRDLD
jgi:hypothetical protein